MSLAPPNGPVRPSARHVTTGYQNAFHRTFLYALGLGADEIAQPFAGLAVALHDGSPDAASVRDLAERVRRAAWRHELTPREFRVPITSADATDVTGRELVADSVELVVRGHWYDCVLAVCGDARGIFGSAMAVARLGVPGVVFVPGSGPTASADDARRFVVSLGIGVADDERTDVLEEAVGRVGEAVRVGGDAPGAVVRHRWDTAPHTIALPPVGRSSGLVHAAAVLHEVGVASLTAALLVGGEGTAPRPRLVSLVAGGEHLGLGICDASAGEFDAPAVATVARTDGGVTLHLRTHHERRIRVVPWGIGAGEQRPTGDQLWWLGDRDVLPDLLSDEGATELLVVAADAADVGVGDVPDGPLACAVIGATQHPGPNGSPLRYDVLAADGEPTDTATGQGGDRT